MYDSVYCNILPQCIILYNDQYTDFFLYIDRSYIIKYIFFPLGLDLFQFNVNALCSKKYFVLILFARIKFFSSIFSMTSV